ncbi:MAG: hypothetical protein MJ170_04210 [Alphaproteobacteria bacterium]|nr:hypothetical protein [Alphaproteobacteria bacterium]
MKRIFIILCLMTICNISYADIASVGYVDSVVDSLPAVAKTGSYNDLSNKPTIPTVPTTISSFTNDSGYITTSYHDSTKQDKLPNGPSDGIYKMVWNGRFKTFMFQKESDLLSCPDGQYDIGLSQCIDVSQSGTGYGYINFSGTSSSADVYGLTENGTWGTTLYTGDKVTGIASCNSTPGSTRGETTTEEFSQSSEGQYCWCKMTSPSASRWVFASDKGSADKCVRNCVDNCGYFLKLPARADFRSGFFSSVGQ